jgi:hypothetical protein
MAPHLPHSRRRRDGHATDGVEDRADEVTADLVGAPPGCAAQVVHLAAFARRDSIDDCVIRSEK